MVSDKIKTTQDCSQSGSQSRPVILIPVTRSNVELDQLMQTINKLISEFFLQKIVKNNSGNPISSSKIPFIFNDKKANFFSY